MTTVHTLTPTIESTATCPVIGKMRLCNHNLIIVVVFFSLRFRVVQKVLAYEKGNFQDQWTYCLQSNG